MSAGTIAIEETAKKFADMTATEVKLGFGDKLCDFREALAQVKIFAEAESSTLSEKDAADQTSAKAMHNKTEKKKAKDKE